jgi:hypothetical protein
MNGVHYKTALENHLLRFMELHKTQWFIRAGMGRLKEIENTFSIMDWPEKFPNLNPIENCWSYMKHKLKRDHTIKSHPKLITAIKMMWVKTCPWPISRS